MAIVPITKTPIPVSNAGFNLTDATFADVTNGDTAQWTYASDDLVVLKGSGNAATLAAEVQPMSTLTQYNALIGSAPITAPFNKILLVRLSEIFPASDGLVSLDVGGSFGTDGELKILVMR
jgi:hypothetical protein